MRSAVLSIFAPLLKSEPPQDYPGGWTESLLRLQQIDGAVHGVPFHDGPECLIYRKDLFEDAAIRARYEEQFNQPLAPPRTWDEFHRIARFLHDPAKQLYGTVFAAFPDGHNSVYDFLLQLWTRGGDLFDPQGKVHFATPEAEKALTFYRSILADTAAIHPDCRTLDSVQAGLAFAAGHVAMMVNWFGFATMAHTSPDSAVRGNVDIAEIPAAEQGSTASLNVYWMLSIAAGSPHQQQAWQFLRHNLTPAMDKLTTTLRRNRLPQIHLGRSRGQRRHPLLPAHRAAPCQRTRDSPAHRLAAHRQHHRPPGHRDRQHQRTDRRVAG